MRWWLVIVALAAVPASAQPAPTGAAVEVTGATYAELDDATGIWTLRGAPVTVRRGAMVLRAPAMTYETRPQVVRATGGASYQDDALSLQAPEITAWIPEERVLAADRVIAVQAKDDLRLTAARLELFGKEKRLVATGAATVTSPDAALSAERIEAFGDREEVLAEGEARITRGDLDGRAPRITLQRRLATAVLSGGAVVRQGRNSARAQTITVDLRRRRIIAAGEASVTVYPDR